MAARKRRAEGELTPDNWSTAADSAAPDGGFQRASEEELAKRSFKKAKRRLDPDSSSSLETTGAFSGFKGFSATGGITGLTGQSATFKSNPSSSLATSSIAQSSTFKPNPSSSLATTSIGLSTTAKTSSVPVAPVPKLGLNAVSSITGSQATKNSLTQEEYEERLSALNTSFVSWITKHHEKDPLADFTPTFDDYKKHLAKLDAQLRPSSSSSSLPTVATSVGITAKPLSSLPSLSSSSAKETNGSSTAAAAEASKSVTFAPISTGAATNTTAAATAGLFSFSGSIAASSSSSATPSGIGSSLKLASSGITFPASILKPSNSGASDAPSALSSLAPVTNAGSSFFSGLAAGSGLLSGMSGGLTSGLSGGIPPFLQDKGVKQDGGDDDDNDMEKDDMQPQQFDEDADIVHSINAKLFYKKGSEFSELGVGMFKVINMDGKTQLLMRNSTRLGTILLNVMLGSSTPCSRVGKNNVMLMSPPNPPLAKGKEEKDSATPVTYLIRVKSKEDADELHQKLSDRKK